MAIQTIQRTSEINRETGAHFVKTAAVSQTASEGMSSTWKKFSWDTTATFNGTVDVDASLKELYEQMEAAWNAERYDEALKGLDVILEKYLPAMNDLFRAVLMAAKSKCYEELGQFDEALDATEQALLAVKKHEATIGSWLDDLSNDQAHPIQFLEFRRAGLLLLTGQEEAAFAALRANQPTQISGALLYHFLEKRSGQSLLECPATEKEDLKSLFMAGKYAEVIEKTANLPERPAFSFDDPTYRLRAASLAMTGKLDEALSIYQGGNSWRSAESETIYQLISALKGEKVDMNALSGLEMETGVPVDLFLKWAPNA